MACANSSDSPAGGGGAGGGVGGAGGSRLRRGSRSRSPSKGRWNASGSSLSRLGRLVMVGKWVQEFKECRYSILEAGCSIKDRSLQDRESYLIQYRGSSIEHRDTTGKRIHERAS